MNDLERHEIRAWVLENVKRPDLQEIFLELWEAVWEVEDEDEETL